MELAWVTNHLAACCHVAEGIARGLPLVDSHFDESFVAAARALRQEIAARQVPARPFWANLLAYSHQVDDRQSLVRTSLRKTIGIEATSDDAVQALATRIRDLESASRRSFPRMLDDLDHRVRPLQTHWEARGPGLLHAIGNLTDEQLLVDRATIIAVHPAFGGGGTASLTTNSVRIEAVLTNSIEGLPEVVRLGWLLAQLNHDLPVFAERVHGSRLPLVAQLAMLPATLEASETVELSQLTPFTVAEALSAWYIEVASEKDLSVVLLDWWYTYLETKPAWCIALAALDQMIAT